jgi:hypothetical protein
MRKRVVGGGVVVGILGLAWWLSGLNRGPGTGEEGTSNSQPASTSTDTEDGSTDLDSDDRDSPSPGQGSRLTVLITGDQYEIVQRDGNIPATLPEIVDLARRMPGDDDGIRVQITHDPTGVAGARTDLVQALAEAGLTQDALRIIQQPVQ